jgi:hypothetical protein
MSHAPVNGLAYYEVQIGETGTPVVDDGLTAAVGAGGIDDIFVLAHGWNTSTGSAQDLYQAMFGLLADQLGAHKNRTAAVGVIWPSLLFPEDDPAATAARAPATGADVAAALAPAFPRQGDDLAEMGKLLDTRPQDPAELVRFHRLASGLVTSQHGATTEDSGEAAARLADGNTASVFGFFAALSKAVNPGHGAAGAAGNPFSTLWSGAREVLRTLGYYEMKNRAGVVGEKGLGPLLTQLRHGDGTFPRIHLMGHSFGARMVSFALRALPAGPASPVKSLLLVQAAFSHFTFAEPLPIDAGRNGALVDCRDRVDGPLLATFSAADRALGWWYPTASMLSHQDSEAQDDLTYRWGAVGHDGFQQAGAIDGTLLATGAAYTLSKNAFYRLDANAVIKADQSPLSGAHSDIRHSEILWAATAAAGLT